MPRIRFDFGSFTLEADLLDTPTARAIAAALPFETQAMTWGEESSRLASITSTVDGAPLEKVAPPKDRLRPAQPHHVACKIKQGPLFRGEMPVEPCNR